MVRVVSLVLVLSGLLPAWAGAAPPAKGLSLLGVTPGMTIQEAREHLAARGGRLRRLGEKDGLFRWRWKGRGVFPGGPEVVVQLSAAGEGKDVPVEAVVAWTDDPGPVAREWRRELARRFGPPETERVDVRDRHSGELVEGTLWTRAGLRAVLVVIKEGTPRGIRVRRVALFLEKESDPAAIVRRRYREVRGW